MKLTATMDFLCNEKKKGNKLLKLRVSFNKKIHILRLEDEGKTLEKALCEIIPLVVTLLQEHKDSGDWIVLFQ